MRALGHPLIPEQRPISLADIVGLLVSLVLVTAPHALRAPWWLGVLTALLFAWRLRIAMNGAALPSRWMLLAITVLGMFGVWLEFRTLFGRSPGIILLMLFAGLKLLESRTHRDASVIAFLCYFLVITNFLYTQTIPTALLMCLAVLAITATLVGFNAPNRALRDNLRTAGLLFAHAAPAALVLFLLFPRVQGPLWGVPQDSLGGVTGLSESMAPGNLAQVALSDSIAFRAEFQGDPPPQRLRYWRGPVLWDFDGRTWNMGFPEIAEQIDNPAPGPRFDYSVVLEAHNRNWMFALETPVSAPAGARMTLDGQLLARNTVRARIRYDLSSVASGIAMPDARESSLARALRLPRSVNPKAIELAQGWRRDLRDDAAVLARAIEFMRAQRLTYTLEPPLLGRDTVDEFLFTTKAGFCEHFSSAFTFLMRAAGIPARVVTGYQGGEPNPVDRIITVRQSDAHAWSEVHIAGRGWVRVDPTALAVPGRVEQGLARSVPNTDPVPYLMRPQLEWLRSLRYEWEAVSHKWNLWVLGYNPDRQRDLLAFVGMKDADWRTLTAALFTLLGLLTLGLLAWAVRRMVLPDPVKRAWDAFCMKLATRGVARQDNEGPLDYSARVTASLPGQAGAVSRIAALYIQLRYGRDPEPEQVAELRRLVREFRLQ